VAIYALQAPDANGVNQDLLQLLMAISLVVSETPPAGQTTRKSEILPWSPEVRCNLNPAHPQGLHAGAYSALQTLQLAHRITQAINDSSDRGNVHYADGTINGKPYTGAVDISVRCLTPNQIKALLGRLAEVGFAAWYRLQGQDDWTGPPHVHAVWAGCRLKPVLQYQVESWLDGRNGLSFNRPYQFWKPSAEMQTNVLNLYRTSNGRLNNGTPKER
jgi:hypothetical protein